MNKLNFAAYRYALNNAKEEVQDGRYFGVNCVMVELVSIDQDDYLVIYSAVENTGPDTANIFYNGEHCAGVIHIPGDQWSKANTVFTELFGVALKDGLRGVKAYYDSVA